MMAEPYQAGPDQVHRATMNPGDIILHHCRTVHFSARNTSDKSRLGMVVPYSAPNLGEDPALKAFYKEVSATVGSALRH
jgi:ectoine hydroxylase-related dioxygenase (phytanoyl-CoA dioxygenase family)